jgi:hypothetical protein
MMTEPRKISRREFVIATSIVGGGMSICLLEADAAQTHEPTSRETRTPAVELSPWITISPDDTVLMRV